MCWGDNQYGQTDALAGDYKAVSGGDYYGCSIATDGTLTCWGDTPEGWTADPSNTYEAVSAGDFHTCALAIDGTIDCWGPVPPPEDIRWVTDDG